MNATPGFRPARDIQEIAGRESSKTLPDEDGDTLPVPVKMGSDVALLIMYYQVQGLPPAQRTILPPHHAMYVDGRTGQVLRFSSISPPQLGINNPGALVAGVGVSGNIDVNEFMKNRNRLLDISPEVWNGFASALPPSDPKIERLAGEYWDLFGKVANEQEVPFYLQAAPDFFAWVRFTGRSATGGKP